VRFHHSNQFRTISCYISFLLIAVALGIGPVAAVPLGLPESTAKIGYSAGLAWVSIDDPDGDTQAATGTQPFGLIYTDWFLGDFRYWSEVYYYSASLDASATDIGQDVERYGARFSVQKNFRVMQRWAPWLGAGVDLSQAKYTLRHTLTDDGLYLGNRYDDRDEFAVSLLLNAVSEWSLSENWSVSLKLEQSIPLSGDVTDFVASGGVLYRY